MRDLKQMIVLRKDLGMRKGKMVAQGAHASMKVFFDRMEEVWHCHNDGSGEEWKAWECSMTREMEEWKEGIFTKICVGCDSEEELLNLKATSDEQEIVNALIQDCGLTEFKGVPTYTCLAIGPDVSEKIDPITGHLKLL